MLEKALKKPNFLVIKLMFYSRTTSLLNLYQQF